MPGATTRVTGYPTPSRTGCAPGSRIICAASVSANSAAVNLRVLGEDEPSQLFTDQLGAMITARDEGLIRGIGLSNVSYEQLLHALEITEIACVQNPFNLVDRSSQSVLDECITRDIAFVPFFPLGSAFNEVNPC